jgi:hypothetical protein
MRLGHDEAGRRLAEHDHGVLSTVHPVRGADAVPVVYAVDDGFVGIPIDQVKPKAPGRLRREENLSSDPRATLLVEHWDRDDWSRLWWVRGDLTWMGDEDPVRDDRIAACLAGRFAQYADRPFDRLLVFRLGAVTGWAATPDAAGASR